VSFRRFTQAAQAALLSSAISFWQKLGSLAENPRLPGTFQRTGAHTALVAAAVNLGGRAARADLRPAHIERATALGAINLVRGEGDHVEIISLHVDRNFSPAACHPSEWNKTPFSLAILPIS